MNLILEPQNIKATDQIGGKAEGLLWLHNNGYESPEWVVVPSSVIDVILGDSKKSVIDVLKSTNKKNYQNSIERIKAFLSNLQVTQKFEESLFDWIKKENLSTDSFAVRSSFLGEDSEDHSFAGQLETFLNVKPEDICKSITKCIKASFSKNIILYKLQNKLPLENHDMSVIIQKMIFAEKSGVCFSLNPNTFNQDELYISATFGDCDGLVSGTSDCDTFVVNKSTGEVQKDIIKKEVYSNLFEGKKLDSLPPELSEMPVLDNKDLAELSLKTKAIERLKNAPQDIEWAFTDKLYFLQVRPVTAKNKSEIKDSSIVFDNSNIQESYCGITLPLTFSLASDSYRIAYNQLMSFMGFGQREIDKNDFRHSNMLSYVDGRVYYNISSWYDGLRLMPSFGKSKEDMESMMGVEEPVDFVEDVNFTALEKLKQVPKIIHILFKFVTRFAAIDLIVKTFDRNFWKSYREIQSFLNNEKLSAIELIKIHDDITRKFLKRWAAPLVNDFFVMVYNGKVRSVLKEINELESLSTLTMGEDLESLKPTKKIQELAALIKEEKLSKLFEDPNESTFKMLCANKKVKTPLLEFIDLYGDRCIGELKVETQTYRQNPLKLMKLVKNYVFSEAKNTSKLEEVEALQERVKTKIIDKKGKLSFFFFNKNLKKLKKGIRYRESMRLHRTRVVGLYRDVYVKLSKHLKKNLVINEESDIYYLSHNEIVGSVCAKGLTKDLSALVGLRKAEFEAYNEKEPKHHFKANFPYTKNYQYFSEEKASTDINFKGIGCYPGVVEAPVELMLTPDETKPLSGKILCTMRTDPGWAPLFPQIDGLLVERGSSLSHSAVVAREMGIPTVVGVKGITKRLSSGDFIRLDGKTGDILIADLKGE